MEIVKIEDALKKFCSKRKFLTKLCNYDTIIGSKGVGTIEEHLEKLYAPMIKELTMFDNPIKCFSVENFKSKMKINSDILDGLEELKSLGCSFILAGGKVRDWIKNVSTYSSKNDYDLWFLDERSWDIANEYFETTFKGMLKRRIEIKPHVTEYYIREDTYTWKFQLVRGKYGSVEDLLSDFDFSCCSVAYDGENIYCAKYALRDIFDKRIRFQKLKPNRNIFVRVEKYLRKGYFIKHGDYAIASIGLLSTINNDSDSILSFSNRENVIFARDNNDYYPVGGGVELERWQLKKEREQLAGPTSDYADGTAQAIPIDPFDGQIFDVAIADHADRTINAEQIVNLRATVTLIDDEFDL